MPTVVLQAHPQLRYGFEELDKVQAVERITVCTVHARNADDQVAVEGVGYGCFHAPWQLPFQLACSVQRVMCRCAGRSVHPPVPVAVILDRSNGRDIGWAGGGGGGA